MKMLLALSLMMLALMAAPAGAQPDDLDPATIGTWILPVPTGRWVWVIHPDGAYDFHSEAADGALPHSGRFRAQNGQWSMIALNGYADGGTYQMAGDSFIATGRLGRGVWLRMPSIAPH